MKRIIYLVMMICMIGITGCSLDMKEIEDYPWKLNIIQTTEQGKVIYYSEANTIDGKETWPEARIMELVVNAKEDKIIITDTLNDIDYEGTYYKADNTGTAICYRLEFGGKDCIAEVSYTNEINGKKYPTLVISNSEYILYFDYNKEKCY